MAVCGGGILVQQAAEQYTKYDVITMTKIKRKTEMIMPTITTCPKKEDRIQDMLLYSYFGPFPHTECKGTNLTLYNHYPINCLQINYGANKTEWLKAEGEGTEQGYTFIMYIPPSSPVTFTVTNNSARVVFDEVRQGVNPGQFTKSVLTKTIQTSLGPPHSSCNVSLDYRQVNCVEDCINKVLAEACGCEYPAGCNAGQLKSDKCRDARIYNISTIKSHCRYQCPVECNQVKFALNRVDIDLKRGSIDSYKDKISHKFNISGMSDDTIRGRLAFLSIYFEQLETTEITQSPSMTTTNLFGNVGGLLSKAI